jgi:hypothetical protein
MVPGAGRRKHLLPQQAEAGLDIKMNSSLKFLIKMNSSRLGVCRVAAGPLPIPYRKRGCVMPAYRIIVDLSDRQLYLLDGDIVRRSFPVAIGSMVTRTPTGEFTIINKQLNPGGPFGALWMGLSKPHYGIHGTNDPSSIGRDVSRGCIRMFNEDVVALSSLVPVGTRVTIRP